VFVPPRAQSLPPEVVEGWKRSMRFREGVRTVGRQTVFATGAPRARAPRAQVLRHVPGRAHTPTHTPPHTHHTHPPTRTHTRTHTHTQHTHTHTHTHKPQTIQNTRTGIAALYFGVELAAFRLRGADDWRNTAAAGAVAGGYLGTLLPGPSRARGALLGAAAGGAVGASSGLAQQRLRVLLPEGEASRWPQPQPQQQWPGEAASAAGAGASSEPTLAPAPAPSEAPQHGQGQAQQPPPAAGGGGWRQLFSSRPP
jgi:hypothetical protein